MNVVMKFGFIWVITDGARLKYPETNLEAKSKDLVAEKSDSRP
jgi:hypothetical protein